MRIHSAGTWKCVLLAVLVADTAFPLEEASPLLRADSRAPYVHRLTLYDHDGQAIDPRDEAAGPYSPRMTCGKCHPYDQIAGGWHFNAPRAERGLAGRPGEPWFLREPRGGTAALLSGRGWPGTASPAEAKLSAWQFVKQFGPHTPGGGYGERGAEEVKGSREAARWRVSGPLEIDCMFCHSADWQHDPAEAARQIEAENFRWAPTAALGLAVVRGEARKAPDDWDPTLPPDPDHPGQAGPKLIWDLTRFDPDDRVLFNITRRPPSERCYFCHSFREVGPGAAGALAAARDVHLSAGLLCVDCHRNELDHVITRGYEEEAELRGRPELAAYTCEGCHLGEALRGREDEQEDAEDQDTDAAPALTLATSRATTRPAGAEAGAEVRLGGRYRAPHPVHRGLPPIHFRKLTCTACHAGPWPDMDARRFQTALAHGLGLATRERTDQDPPEIAGPIFMRLGEKIAPHRVARGSAGLPYAWPIAHDVRPAAQSLGVRDCTDCHAGDAPIYFGRSAPAGGPATQPAATMAELRGDSVQLARLWGLGFRLRPAFKWFGFICAALIGLALLAGVLDLSRAGPSQPDAASAARAGTISFAVLLLGFLVLAATGYGAYLGLGGLGGWTLLVHMLAAPPFMIGLVGVALTWAPRRRFGREPGTPPDALAGVQKLAFWILLGLGFIVTISILLTMTPLYGYTGQAFLREVHEHGGTLFVAAIVFYGGVALASRRRPKEVVRR